MEMNNRTFIKERPINNRFIDLLNKQRIMVPLILDISVIPGYECDCKDLLHDDNADNEVLLPATREYDCN